MSAPSRAVRVVGEVSDLLMAAVRLSAREPNRSAAALPYLLQLAEFDNYENSCLTAAEVAAIRWLQVARSTSAAVAEALAARLWQQGFHAVAFDPDSRTLRPLAEAIGTDAARDLAALLAGRLYLVPIPPWTAVMGAEIQSDVQKERALGFHDETAFPLCPARDALLDRCEALARGEA